ncbi:hypothetical protein L1049_020628 [Liquidambar formosana]|uniref:Acyl-CoA-binding domain-containing protein n=1 Tax=Liquidambar formosana TaxID=63359 RepID=A0AAP0SDD5_LIQFO
MSRRRALGLACRCRNPYNFRPTGVQGYFAVDVGDYEPGGVYSAIQIRKSRDSFRPSETLDFIKQLALTPRDSDQKSIDWVKNKATVFAYRKAVFEEFDETYAQAFGMQPVRPSHEPKDLSGVPVKVPPRVIEDIMESYLMATVSFARIPNYYFSYNPLSNSILLLIKVDVAELRQKLQTMETLQKELELLQRQKAASEQAALNARQRQSSGGVWGWIAGTPGEKSDDA